MAKATLLTTGGYRGLEAAVGKTFTVKKFLGHWLILGTDLEEAGAKPVMKDYAFLQRELRFTWQA